MARQRRHCYPMHSLLAILLLVRNRIGLWRLSG